MKTGSLDAFLDAVLLGALRGGEMLMMLLSLGTKRGGDMLMTLFSLRCSTRGGSAGAIGGSLVAVSSTGSSLAVTELFGGAMLKRTGPLGAALMVTPAEMVLDSSFIALRGGDTSKRTLVPFTAEASFGASMETCSVWKAAAASKMGTDDAWTTG